MDGMTVSELLVPGLNLMVLGMGTVFAFLALLVMAVTTVSSQIRKYEAKRAVHPPPPAPTVAPVADAELMAVISAAVHRYRQSR